MSQPVTSMMLQYTYFKPRNKFGKQCVFEVSPPVGVEDIWPNPRATENFIQCRTSHRQVQLSTQFATHTVQTDRKTVKNTGTLHTEGGWPKEVNPRDGESVYRFRRRVEKDFGYVSSITNLLPLMEHHVLQNNAVNIHKNFFDDMIPTPLVKQYDMRIWNSYGDPQRIVRPIRSLSWSPNGSNRLAAAYSFTEFEEHPVDVNPYSYVWDVGNAIKPLITLETSSPMLSIQFSPRDISMLISGHMSGQVCCWDIRIGGKPVETSHIFHSHGDPATQAFWISSKANTEFFSSSINGTIMWWDIRFMKRPTNVLVVDLNDPRRADRFKAVSVTALNFEHTMSNKFLVGLINGLAFNINKKNISPEDIFAMKFECYAGPVHALDRNPFSPKNFLTIGDWSAKIWSDDTREGYLLNTSEQKVSLTGGCWSRSRGSIFFITKRDGILEAYDILTGMRKPLTSINVCNSSLTAISPHEEGELLAVGSSKGTVYVLECLEGLTTYTREDRARLNYYLEAASRFEKVLDTRLKEIRLYYNFIEEAHPEILTKSKTKIKVKEDSKEKKKGADVKKKGTEDAKKHKRARPRRRETITLDLELLATQKHYFQIVEEESSKMEDIDPEDAAAAQSLLRARVVTRSEEMPEKSQEEDLKRERSRKSIRIRRTRSRRRRSSAKHDESDMTIEPSMDDDRDTRRGRARRRSLLKSCPMEVCEPEICCKDVIEKRRLRKPRRISEDKKISIMDATKPFVLKSTSYQTISEYTDQIPKPTHEFKRKIFKQRHFPQNILEADLAKAKTAVRAWQDQILAGKLSFRTVARKIEKTPRVSVMVDAPQISWDKIESQEEMMEKRADQPAGVMTRNGARKSYYGQRRFTRKRKTKITLEEELQLAELRKQENWRQLKQRVKELDVNREAKWSYPRISAARRVSENNNI